MQSSWRLANQARLILFAKDTISCKIVKQPQYLSAIPTITLEVRTGREKATLVNYTYREHTGGISGQGDLDSQKERLKAILRWGRDLVCMGDINLDYRKWASSTYSLKSMVDMVKEFQANTLMSKWVARNRGQ